MTFLFGVVCLDMITNLYGIFLGVNCVEFCELLEKCLKVHNFLCHNPSL